MAGIRHHKDLTGNDLHVNKLHANTHQHGGADPLDYAPVINVMNYGAAGDGVTDDTVAVQAAITYAASSKIPLVIPKGTYRLSAPLVIPSGQGFTMLGDGNRSTIFDVTFAGYAITSTDGQAVTIKDVKIDSLTVGNQGLYSGIYISGGYEITLDNITVFHCLDGIVLDSGTYFTNVSNFYVYLFKGKAIYLKGGSNSNRFGIQSLYGFSEATVGSAGIFIELGNVNTFELGTILHCETAVYQVTGIRNVVRNIWIELITSSITILAGDMYIDTHGCFVNTIAEGARLFNYNGMSTPHLDLTKDMLKEDKDLKALWFFNEGAGAMVLDKSGNKKHATLQGTPTWTTDGTWGTAVHFKHSDGRDILIPLDTVDWTQPFTVLWNYASVAVAAPIGLGIEQGGDIYLWMTVSAGNVAAGLFNNPTSELPTEIATGRYGSLILHNIWCVLYVDPVNKTIEALDPFGATGKIQFTNAFPITAPTEVLITGRNHASNVTEGDLSLCAFYQRKLSLNEVYDIVNSVDRPFKHFDKAVQLSTILVSPDGSNYQITVTDAGVVTATLV